MSVCMQGKCPTNYIIVSVSSKQILPNKYSYRLKNILGYWGKYLYMLPDSPQLPEIFISLECSVSKDASNSFQQTKTGNEIKLV